jgi:hypothetical protein
MERLTALRCVYGHRRNHVLSVTGKVGCLSCRELRNAYLWGVKDALKTVKKQIKEGKPILEGGR